MDGDVNKQVVSRGGYRLTILPGRFAVCRLHPASPVPPWVASTAGFTSITRTADELSIVCREPDVPDDTTAERGHRLFRVEGPLPFDAVGVLAQLTAALAAAGVSILAIGTYETDYLLVRESLVATAVGALRAAGCGVTAVTETDPQAPISLQKSRRSDPVGWAPLALRKLADSNMVGVMVVSPSGAVLDANAAVLDMLGYSREQLEAGDLDWRTMTPPEYAEADRRVLEMLRTRGVAPPFEREYVRADGSRVPVLLMAGSCGPPGEPELAFCFVLDQTVRHESDRALRSSERRFRMLADAAPILIWMADADKRCTFLNRRWLEFCGRPLDEALAADRLGHVHPEDADRVRRTFDDSFDTRQSFRMEYRLLRHDGTYRWILDYGVPLTDDEGMFAGYLGSCVDITGRRVAEQQREQLLARARAARREAVRLGRVKDEFLGTLSHELRTPLNAILGWTQVLRRGGRPEHIAPGLEVIDRNARMLTQLVDDLLDVSEIVTGRVRLQLQPIELPAVVAEALGAVQAAADARKVRLACEPSPELPRVTGDASRLQQIAWNLVSNAVKFTPPGGQVLVRLAHTDGHVGFTVEDTGEGIPPEFLPHVFDRFTQADASASRHHGGLGLGLAIVRHLVELHGGQVLAHSEGQGRGSRFTVLLPAAGE